MIKRVITILILVCMTCNVHAESPVLDKTAEYVYKTVTHPVVGSVGGEWAVLGLARSGAEIPTEYFDTYYGNVEAYVKKCNGIVHERKYTEYSRLVIALTAIGRNPADVAGYNLLTPLGDYKKVIQQGVNGAAWALTALDCGGYEMPVNGRAEVQATREMYIEYLLSEQNIDGGWSLTGDDSDADITGMVLQALSDYLSDERVKTAVERALSAPLSYTSSESYAQMITALCELGIEPDISIPDEYHINGGFRHYTDETEINLMATEQCLYALAAVRRHKQGQASLFDMKDVTPVSDEIKDVKTKTFDDIKNHAFQSEIEALAGYGIINGKSDMVFDPDSTMTRAEFATVMTRGLKLEGGKTDVFSDVLQTDWFYDFVSSAYSSGIVKGVSEREFNPHGTITREQAVVMIARGAAYMGMNTSLESFAVRNALAGFTDYQTLSDWAKESMAFCCSYGIFPDEALEIKPVEYVTRGEIAMLLYNMLVLTGGLN